MDLRSLAVRFADFILFSFNRWKIGVEKPKELSPKTSLLLQDFQVLSLLFPERSSELGNLESH